MGMNGFTGVVETGSNAPANMASTLLEIYLNEMYQNGVSRVCPMRDVFQRRFSVKADILVKETIQFYSLYAKIVHTYLYTLNKEVFIVRVLILR